MIETLELVPAAKFVNLHPQTLRERAKAGKIPGASKPGKEWVFLLPGLVAYLNSLSPCPYTGEAGSGGSKFHRTQAELDEALGLPTGRPRRSTTKR